MAKKEIEIGEVKEVKEIKIEKTEKEKLQELYQQLKDLGVNSIGDLEVKISRL